MSYFELERRPFNYSNGSMSITHRFETFELLISSSSWNCIELYCPELHWTSKVPVSAVHRTEKRFDNEFRFRTSKILTESSSRSKCFELLEVNTSKWLLRITQSECLKLLETVRTARAFQGDYSKKFFTAFSSWETFMAKRRGLGANSFENFSRNERFVYHWR